MKIRIIDEPYLIEEIDLDDYDLNNPIALKFLVMEIKQIVENEEKNKDIT